MAPTIWKNAGEDGQFRRQTSTFRDTIKREDMQAGRYILYVNAGCPWANRTIIVRSFKKLEDVIDIAYTSPTLSDDGWLFDGSHGSDRDPVNDFRGVKAIYFQQDPDYSLRFTVPILYDKQTKRIVNNESSEIIRVLNDFSVAGKPEEPDLYPEALRKEIDEINAWIYDGLNNGVYKAGFASQQAAYEEHAWGVFKTLDRLEELLADRDYLVGPGRGQLTEADVRLFPTIARFDNSYHYFFRCNLWKIADHYPNVDKHFHRLYKMPAFRDATKPDLFKIGYAASQKTAHPIVPIGPAKLYD